METVLGRGYSIDEEFGMIDFYSPPSSIIDEDEEYDDDGDNDDLFYREEEHDEIEQTDNTTLKLTSIDKIYDVDFSKINN